MYGPIRPIHGFLTKEDEKRFWARVAKKGPDDCWLFGACHSYGSFAVRGCCFTAHRLAWVLTHRREVPEGMLVCHSCDTHPCVNPAHLWIGTFIDNQRDASAKGRQPKYFASEERAAAIANVPLSQRSTVARAAYYAEREERHREAAERRARWLARIGMTEEEWMTSATRAQRLERQAAARLASAMMQAEAEEMRQKAYQQQLEQEYAEEARR